MRHFLPFMLLVALSAGSTLAQHASGAQHSILAQASAAGQKTAKGTGLIQRIDRKKRVVTIKHGPLPALNMSAMTMTYAVKDERQLANLQPLQKVDFELSYDGKNYVITKIN